MLPDNFHFSQRILQDYLDCPRRFQLQHLERLSWPAAPSEPYDRYEELRDLGNRFHHLVHQHLSGLSSELILESISRQKLQTWFIRYLKEDFLSTSRAHYSEITLTSLIDGTHFIGKFDFIAQDSQGNFRIIDWKTSSKEPDPGWLKSRAQTMLYPALFLAAGRQLFPEQTIAPDKVKMVYWYPEHPDQSIVFPFSEEIHDRQLKALQKVVRSMQNNSPHQRDLAKTENTAHCRFCVFRSYCDRGIEAGAIQDSGPELLEAESALDEFEQFDFEQIEMIRY